jgi:hypothetical protein
MESANWQHGAQMGTGLGLFISKSIIEAHGGKIWAENNNDYDGIGGATFCFMLSIVNKEQQEQGQQLSSQVANENNSYNISFFQNVGILRNYVRK